mgnify:CR=1 FL=1
MADGSLRVLLIGSPNSGTSLLFNRLTGLSQKVANFPGITVDVGMGAIQALPDHQLVDFPGTYSLQAISAEEQIAVEQFEHALEDPDVEQVLCLIDATRLEKSLYFTLQVIRDCQRNGKRVTVLANMIDVLDRHGLELDTQGLADALGTRVLPISARSGKGIEGIIQALQTSAGQPATGKFADTPDELLRGEAHQLARPLSVADVVANHGEVVGRDPLEDLSRRLLGQRLRVALVLGQAQRSRVDDGCAGVDQLRPVRGRIQLHLLHQALEVHLAQFRMPKQQEVQMSHVPLPPTQRWPPGGTPLVTGRVMVLGAALV